MHLTEPRVPLYAAFETDELALAKLGEQIFNQFQMWW